MSPPVCVPSHRQALTAGPCRRGVRRCGMMPQQPWGMKARDGGPARQRAVSPAHRELLRNAARLSTDCEQRAGLLRGGLRVFRVSCGRPGCQAGFRRERQHFRAIKAKAHVERERVAPMAGKTDPLDELEAALKQALRAARRLRRAHAPKPSMPPQKVESAPELRKPRRPKRPAPPGAMKNLRKAQKRLEEMGVKPYRPRATPRAQPAADAGRSTSAGSVRPSRQ